MNLFDPEFYPTPPEVIEKMLLPYADRLHKMTVLEPSAGNGAILDHLCKRGVRVQYTTKRGETYSDEAKTKPERLYCLEKNPELRLILQQKGYRVLGDDFLAFQPEHRFDLVAMNPPFSDGDRHLLHAWDILDGGDIVCLLNAETVRNTFSASRKRLAALIAEHGTAEPIGQAFLHADNPTDVEVVIVRLHKEPKEDPFRIDTDGLSAEKAPDFAEMAASGDLPAQGSRLDAYIRCWDLTKASAVELIKAYSRFLFYAKAFINANQYAGNSRADNVAEALLKDLGDMRYGSEGMADVYNRFIDRAKSNAWGRIFDEIGLGKYMTSGLQRKLDEFRTAQGAASITKENIFALFRFIMANISTIMDQSVVEVYDMFTRYFDGNTSHEEGWKTNKRFKCNRKVILPNVADAGFKPQVYGYNRYFSTSYCHKLSDIDKAMCWLAGRDYDAMDSRYYDICSHNRSCDPEKATIETAIQCIPVGDQDWHESAFFRVKAFKKGTVHLEFKDEALWTKFNLTVNQGKNQIGTGE